MVIFIEQLNRSLINRSFNKREREGLNAAIFLCPTPAAQDSLREVGDLSPKRPAPQKGPVGTWPSGFGPSDLWCSGGGDSDREEGYWL